VLIARAFVGLGSNLGDRLSELRAAVEALRATPSVEVVALSSVYETDPVGPAQPDFLNAVVELRTDLEPRLLLARLKEIEAQAGRFSARVERWGPREVDLDLLLYDDLVIESDRLRIPHPSMHERAFVLVPLCEIDASVVVPGHGIASELLAVVDPSGVRRYGSL
jgi:2-amino-4-hydroxy-6-hydroxymethyldihydropteridine diphosphokinase